MSQNKETMEFNFSIDQSNFKFSLGIFTIVGAMLGLTGAFAISYFSGSGGWESAIISGVISAVVLTIGFLIGPVIATVVGLRIQSQSHLGSNVQYATSATSAFLGYIVMVITLVLVLSLAAGLLLGGGGTQAGDGGTQASDAEGNSGGSIVSLGNLLLPLIGFAIPTGLTGAGTVWIADRYHVAGQSSSQPEESSQQGAPLVAEFSTISSGNLLAGFREALNNISYPVGAIFGVFSILVTSLLLLLLIVSDPTLGWTNTPILGIIPVSLSAFGIEKTPVYIISWLSWMVLHAHGVEVQGLEFELTRMTIFRTVPWVVLLLGGYVVSKLRKSGTVKEAFVDGGSVVVGYAAIIFIFALLTPTGGIMSYAKFVTEQQISINFVGAFLRAGIIYPIAFGGIGGLLHFYPSRNISSEEISDVETDK